MAQRLIWPNLALLFGATIFGFMLMAQRPKAASTETQFTKANVASTALKSMTPDIQSTLEYNVHLGTIASPLSLVLNSVTRDKAGHGA